jgi:E3 ubiquitin-protein ligase UBR1
MHRLVGGWVRHQALWPGMAEVPLAQRTALVSHPGIFELVGLPGTYDALLEECTRRRCPTTGKEVSDPMICLHCGEIFCSQAICCLKEDFQGGKRYNIGGAQQHSRR